MKARSSEELNKICNDHRASYDLPPRPAGYYECSSCDADADCPLILEVFENEISYN